MQSANQANAVDVEKKDNSGNTPLHVAAQAGHLGTLRHLLVLTSFVNQRNHNGETPLHLAAERGHYDVVKMLLESGADPSLQDNNGATPSHLAAAEGYIGIIELLSKKESQFTNRVRIYYDPVPSAHPFELNLARMSLKEKNSSDKENYQTDSSDNVIGDNSTRGEDNEANATKPHHKKTKRGGRKHKKKNNDQENMQVQTIRPDKITDLYLRIMTQYPDDMDEKLRDYFMDGRFDEINCSVIDTNRRDKAGLTILHHAVRCCRYLAVERLVVKCKADVNAETFRGVTPVFLAATTGYSDVIRILHENGADINHTIKCGMTPLHYAVVHKNADSILTLTYLGANLNFPDKNGNTPLHYAAMTRGSLKIIETLVERGGDPQFINFEGLRPLEMAKKVGDREVIQFLASVTEELRGIEITRNFI